MTGLRKTEDMTYWRRKAEDMSEGREEKLPYDWLERGEQEVTDWPEASYSKKKYSEKTEVKKMTIKWR